LPHDIEANGAFRLGKTLAQLRDRGVLIVGSGSLTHNLHEFRQHVRDPEYAQAFADWVARAVEQRDTDSLIDSRALAPFATRAHPTEEHYLPLLVAIGSSHSDDVGGLLRGGMIDQVFSMDSFAWCAAA
jgi:4,5-DOPA dioxygenase extradiol